MYIVSDEVNSYGGRFPAEEHDRLAALLVDSPVMVGHRKDSLPIGRNFHAVTVEKGGRPWVRSYFYWLNSAEGAETLRENIDKGVVTDAVGNFTSADSFYVVVFGPWGDSVFGGSYIGTASEIKAATVGGRKMYRWVKDVSQIDGSTPRPGTYSGVIVAVDTLDGASNAHLDQAFTFSFVLSPSLAERVKIGDSLPDDGITAAKFASHAITADAVSPDAFQPSGSGAFTCWLVAYDSAAHQTIPGVAVAVRSQEQTSLFAVGATGVDGKLAVNLNSGNYSAVATAPGYFFQAPAWFAVAGGMTDTIFGFHFNPGTPSSPSLCRIYGYLFALDRRPEAGAKVSAILPSGVARSGNFVVSPFAVTTTTDSLGYFYLDLIPSDSLVPNNAKYEFSITRSDGTILRQRVRVPAIGSWQLAW